MSVDGRCNDLKSCVDRWRESIWVSSPSCTLCIVRANSWFVHIFVCPLGRRCLVLFPLSLPSPSVKMDWRKRRGGKYSDTTNSLHSGIFCRWPSRLYIRQNTARVNASNHSYRKDETSRRRMPSVKLQTNLCVSSSCESSSEVICRHCSQQYCQMCFMCHRKNIVDDMSAISRQMSVNRNAGVLEVVTFIDKQAKDAHDQAKKLVDDAIDRIVKASKNIYTYIENRRQAKVPVQCTPLGIAFLSRSLGWRSVWRSSIETPISWKRSWLIRSSYQRMRC